MTTLQELERILTTLTDKTAREIIARLIEKEKAEYGETRLSPVDSGLKR